MNYTSKKAVCFRFEKLVTYQKWNGSYKIDYGVFHNTYAVNTPRCSPKEFYEMKVRFPERNGLVWTKCLHFSCFYLLTVTRKPWFFRKRGLERLASRKRSSIKLTMKRCWKQAMVKLARRHVLRAAPRRCHRSLFQAKTSLHTRASSTGHFCTRRGLCFHTEGNIRWQQRRTWCL